MTADKLTTAIVDDFSPYSCNLINEGLLHEKVSILFYGPKVRLNKFYPKSNFKNTKRIWSQTLFPFQIFRQAIVDKPDLVHIQHEINTFGPLYTNLFFPFLLFLLRLTRSKVIITEHSVFDPDELYKS